VILFPTEICVTIFGPAFQPAGEVMRFLAITLALTLLNQVYTSQIMGCNRPDITAKLVLQTFFLNLFLMLVFIPGQLFGIQLLGMAYTGAAIANSITALSLFIRVRVTVKKLTGTPSDPRSLKHLFAGVLAGGAIVLLNTVYHFSGVVAMLIFFIVTEVTFFTTLILLKEFTRSDYKQILDIINPSKMMSYMGDEIKNKK
jgi:O-antigen/teichoic acid export membrane protein